MPILAAEVAAEVAAVMRRRLWELEEVAVEAVEAVVQVQWLDHMVSSRNNTVLVEVRGERKVLVLQMEVMVPKPMESQEDLETVHFMGTEVPAEAAEPRQLVLYL